MSLLETTSCQHIVNSKFLIGVQIIIFDFDLSTLCSLTKCKVIPIDIFNDHIIPGLRLVQEDVLELAPDYEVS